MDGCINCGKIKSKYNQKYCCSACQQVYRYKQYIQRWQEGLENGLRGPESISAHIRRFLFEKYNNQCARCSWSKINPFSKKIPLEIEHIDGDYSNNTENNLTLLCPNCHALTSTYRALNPKGRKRRRKDKN